MLKNDIQSFIQVIHKLLAILTIEQKKKSLGVFFSMIICSCLELLGVSAIYPFIQMMVDVDAIRDKWYIAWLYDLYPNMSTKSGLIIIGLFVILVYLLKNAVALWCNYIQFAFSNRFLRESSTLMLVSYMKRPYEFFHNNNSAQLTRNIDGDTIGVYNEIVSIFELLSQALTVILIGAYLFITDWIIALSACGIAGLCFLAITFGFKRINKESGEAFRSANGEKYQACFQAINGIKEIVVLNRREHFVEAYVNAAKKYEKAFRTNNFISSCPDRIIEGVCIAGFMGIICIRIAVDPNVAVFIPTMATFAMAAFKILPSIAKMSARISYIIFYRPSLENCYSNITEVRKYETKMKEYKIEQTEGGIFELGDSEDAIGKNRLNLHNESCAKISDGKENFNNVFISEIKIDGITWKYSDAEHPVLENLSLSIYKGQSVALIGASGAGKTTLADVILGLLKPQAGRVLMDGRDVYAMPETWSKVIGYVPQSVFLIDDTIRANVAFGLPRDIVDDELIWSALEQAQLAKFVRNLPQGIDTIVGERGIKFSGGQRQRIAIARALYEDPQILVLDEATSALDNETETTVMESINALQGSKTLIIVAHRLTTIRNCDVIYEIADGQAIVRDRDEVLV